MAENAKDAASVTRAQSYRGEAAAAAGLSGQIETENDATRAKALLDEQKARYEQQIEAQRRRQAEAEANVAAAQGDYNMYQSQGRRKEAGEAAQRLAQAQQTATEAKAQTETLIKSLNETLSQIKNIAAQATAVIKKNQSQSLTAQAQQFVSQ